MKTTTAILYAILAAVLYALMAPVSKMLQVSVPPVTEAGLLYLGAGLGMLLIYFSQVFSVGCILHRRLLLVCRICIEMPEPDAGFSV